MAAVETALTLTLQSEYPAANATGTSMAETVTIDRPPVAKSVVAGLARPGGNITGLSNQTGDLAGKRSIRILLRANEFTV